MPRTDNQKVATAYLSPELYDLVENFKSDLGLKSISQALAVIIERFFDRGVSSPNTKTDNNNAVEERLGQLEKKIASMEFSWRDQRDHMLEIINDLLNRTEFLIPPTLESTVDSDVPSTLESTVDSDVPSTLESTVDSDVPSTLESTVDSDVPSTLESTVDSDVPSTVDKDHLWVICKVDKLDRDRFSCWTGSFKQGFTSDLEKAQTYQEKTLKRISNKITNSEHAADTSKEFLSCKILGDLKKMASAIAPQPMPN